MVGECLGAIHLPCFQTYRAEVGVEHGFPSESQLLPQTILRGQEVGILPQDHCHSHVGPDLGDVDVGALWGL